MNILTQKRAVVPPINPCLTGVAYGGSCKRRNPDICRSLLFLAVLSCPFVLYCPVLFCSVLSCPVLSYRVLSCPILSCPVLSCPVLSCLVLSCPALSCPVLSCPVLYFLDFSSPFLSSSVLTCLAVMQCVGCGSSPVLLPVIQSFLFC